MRLLARDQMRLPGALRFDCGLMSDCCCGRQKAFNLANSFFIGSLIQIG